MYIGSRDEISHHALLEELLSCCALRLVGSTGDCNAQTLLAKLSLPQHRDALLLFQHELQLVNVGDDLSRGNMPQTNLFGLQDKYGSAVVQEALDWINSLVGESSACSTSVAPLQDWMRQNNMNFDSVLPVPTLNDCISGLSTGSAQRTDSNATKRRREGDSLGNDKLQNGDEIAPIRKRTDDPMQDSNTQTEQTYEVKDLEKGVHCRELEAMNDLPQNQVSAKVKAFIADESLRKTFSAISQDQIITRSHTLPQAQVKQDVAAALFNEASAMCKHEADRPNMFFPFVSWLCHSVLSPLIKSIQQPASRALFNVLKSATNMCCASVLNMIIIPTILDSKNPSQSEICSRWAKEAVSRSQGQGVISSIAFKLESGEAEPSVDLFSLIHSVLLKQIEIEDASIGALCRAVVSADNSVRSDLKTSNMIMCIINKYKQQAAQQFSLIESAVHKLSGPLAKAAAISIKRLNPG